MKISELVIAIASAPVGTPVEAVDWRRVHFEVVDPGADHLVLALDVGGEMPLCVLIRAPDADDSLETRSE